jgi:nitrogen fixation protein
MKRELAITLSVAAVAAVLFVPQFAHAHGAEDAPAATGSAASHDGLKIATRMVPAHATLLKAIDARKLQPGEQLRVVLGKTVHLKNGPELPRGTQLIGTIEASLPQDGVSKLTVRFTQAEVKGGKVIPIKATILGVHSAASIDADEAVTIPGNQASNASDTPVLRIHQADALYGVDLYGDIAGQDSGVFVSTKKKSDIKLPAGSELVLAIAAESNS